MKLLKASNGKYRYKIAWNSVKDQSLRISFPANGLFQKGAVVCFIQEDDHIKIVSADKVDKSDFE